MSNEETANDRRTGQRRAVKPGEWACIDAKCANINSEKRTSCEVCGKAKPRAKNKVGREIGKDAADKSKGLFSAEDWVCTKCGNVNWARRTTCNICNAPKLGDLEVRTGYGGGFMDRQDVEYIDRDFDEEFDEFGRKKKKRRLHDEDDRNKQEEDTDEDDDDVDVAKYKLDEENESEEDEGDDDELDKYDLTADPEIAEIKIDISKFKKLDEYDMETRASSVASSECSCSCSGGECSCEDSECEDLKKHESKREIEKSTKQSHEHDRENDSREKERDRSRDRHREKGKHGDRKERERDRDRNGRSRSRERDRDRNGRSRSHDHDHRRSRERKRSKDRDHRK